MNRLLLALMIPVAGMALMATGCSDQYKQKIAAMEQDLAIIQKENNDLRKLKPLLAEAQERAGELEVKLQSSSTEVAALKAQLGADADKPAGLIPTGWQETASGVKITLANDILFSAGQAALSTKGKDALKPIAQTIQSTYPNAMVRVYGFTDSDPIVKTAKLWKDNLDLSANRAMAVTRELCKLGIADKNIETIAMGATRFVAPNTTKANKAKNRRVEIVVIKP